MMRRRHQRRNLARRFRQSGYAYFMVFFMITVMIITSQAVLRNMVTEERREREAEMIWRGNQYVRALRLFYRKTGHYPQSTDDLEKGLPDLHFLRPECLKDPMNKADGSWRVIYTNASGQIIGSTRYATMQQMALMDLNGGKLPTVPGQGDASSASGSADQNQSQNQNQNQNQDQNSGASSNSPSTPATGSQDQTQQQSGLGQTSSNPQGLGQPPATQSNPSTDSPFSTSVTAPGGLAAQGSGQLNGLSQGALAAIAQLKPTGPVDGPVFGAFIAGVAGGNHYDANSVKFYKGGKKYSEWEFIWNPLEDQARALQNGLNGQQGLLGQQPGQPGLPIANPNGGAPVTPVNPPGGTPQPSPDQPQQQPQQQQ
jgi:hypothetical protein